MQQQEPLISATDLLRLVCLKRSLGLQSLTNAVDVKCRPELSG